MGTPGGLEQKADGESLQSRDSTGNLVLRESLQRQACATRGPLKAILCYERVLKAILCYERVHLDSLGSTREAPGRQERTNWTAWEAKGRQERTNWTACEAPGRHQGGRKGPIGQPARHQGGRKGPFGQPGRHQGGTRGYEKTFKGNPALRQPKASKTGAVRARA